MNCVRISPLKIFQNRFVLCLQRTKRSLKPDCLGWQKSIFHWLYLDQYHLLDPWKPRSFSLLLFAFFFFLVYNSSYGSLQLKSNHLSMLMHSKYMAKTSSSISPHLVTGWHLIYLHTYVITLSFLIFPFIHLNSPISAILIFEQVC